MHFCAVLNCDGGTCRTMDVNAFATRLTEVMRQAGHEIEVRLVQGDAVRTTIADAAARNDVDAILAIGGDGTVSLAAGLAADHGKVLGIIPAGTMNLYARSLRMPLDLDAAVVALATGRVREVDIARANGRPFMHQFSIGVHPELIRQRSRIPYRSRLGKIAASIRAAISTLLNPPSVRAALKIGDTDLYTRTSAIAVTNNLYGPGHLPYADHPDGGVLGIYVTRAQRPIELLVDSFHMLLGRWEENPQVEIHEATEMRLQVLSRRRRRLHCALDGELYPLDGEVHIKLYPKSLRVLAPVET